MSVTPDEDTSTTAPWPNIQELLEQYEHWLKTPEFERDTYSAFTKLAALYRFALTHMDAPGNELLFEAIDTIENTWNE